mgnify:FL=1
MVLKVLPLVLIWLAGYGLRRQGVLQPQDGQTIAKLISTLALPALILKALATATITPDLIYLPLVGLAVAVALTAIAFLWARWRRWDRITTGTFITVFASFEGGSVGYTLMLLAYGDEGLSRMVLFDLALAVYMLTVVYSLSAWFGQGEGNPRQVLLQLGQTPFFWAIILGLGLNLLQLHPPLIIDTLDRIGSSFLLLILLLLSLEFQISPTAMGGQLGLVLLKTTCGLAFGALAVASLGLTGSSQAAVLVGAALPPSMLSLLFTRQNHLDTGLASGLVSVGIPFSLVVLTLLLAVLPQLGD